MLIIRLQRTGTKNKATFRIVLAQAYRAASKNTLEILGHYNPKNKELGIKNQDRLKYWLAQNVKLSPTVQNLLIEKQVVQGKKVKAWRPKKKAQEDKATEPTSEKSAEAATEAKSESKVEASS